MMLQGLEFCAALVGSYDFGFTGTEVCLILADRFSCNGAPRAVDEKTIERENFEQLNRSAFFDCTTKLTTTAGVVEVCELVKM